MPAAMSPPVERIDVFVGERIPGNRVDREIAPARGVLNCHRWSAGNLEAAMSAPHLGLAAGQRHIDLGDLVHREALADGVDGAEPLEERTQHAGRDAVDLDIDVLRGPAHQAIANPAADDERAPAGIANGLRDGSRNHRLARRRPYRLTNRSVNPGAMTLRTARSFARPYG
jgi:hypothetical protein